MRKDLGKQPAVFPILITIVWRQAGTEKGGRLWLCRSMCRRFCIALVVRLCHSRLTTAVPIKSHSGSPTSLATDSEGLRLYWLMSRISSPCLTAVAIGTNTTWLAM